MTIRGWSGALALVACVLGFGVAAQAGATLDKVKQAGQISCGVQPAVAGFAAPDSQGYQDEVVVGGHAHIQNRPSIVAAGLGRHADFMPSCREGGGKITDMAFLAAYDRRVELGEQEDAHSSPSRPQC